MARLSQEKIAEIQRLYAEIGIYSQVAKKVGCSPATVKKYALSEEKIDVNKIIVKFDKEIPEFSSIDFTKFLEDKVNFTTLDYAEKETLKGLWEEI